MPRVDLADGVEWLQDDASGGNDVTERAAEKHERELANAWAWLIKQPAGRLVIWSLLDRCHILGSSFTANSAQAFLEGERNIGLVILKEYLLPFDAGVLGDLMREAQDRYDHLTAVAEAEIKREQEEQA